MPLVHSLLTGHLFLIGTLAVCNAEIPLNIEKCAQRFLSLPKSGRKKMKYLLKTIALVCAICLGQAAYCQSAMPDNVSKNFRLLSSAEKDELRAFIEAPIAGQHSDARMAGLLPVSKTLC